MQSTEHNERLEMGGTNRQHALELATRIANTRLMKAEGDIENMADKILVTADKFAEWLGPDPVRGNGFPKVEKPTAKEKCPVCGSEMWDTTATRKSENAPIARCKQAGKWDPTANKFTGCQGVIWKDSA